MIGFKEQYSNEELEELTNWFETRMDKLPQELIIDKATKTNNLPLTVERLIKIIKKGKLRVVHSGYVAHLITIKEILIEKGME